jgi:hypothetical protein
MKLFIVALKGLEHPVMPQCARDALACATLFSDMDVVGLSDFVEEGWLDAKRYADRAYKFRRDFIEVCGMEARELPAIMRWFIIEEYAKEHSITAPIIQIDWEVMVFQSLEKHFNRLSVSAGDIGDAVNKELADHNRTNPYWVGNLSTIRFFTLMLEAQVECKTPLFVSHKCGGDMNWWEHARSQGGYTSVDISRETGDAIFDLNILLEKGVYFDHEGAKKVFWKNGKPYFKRRTDEGFVRAVALHCFWTWRDKTTDILQKATSGYSD